MAKELKPCPFCGSDNIQFNTCWDEEAYIFCQCMKKLKEFNAAHEETEAYVKKCAEKAAIVNCDIEYAIDALNEAMSHLEGVRYKY